MHRAKHSGLILACVMACFTSLASASSNNDAAPQWTDAEQRAGYVVFTHSADQRLPAELVPQRAAIVSGVSGTLARDEYESLQIGVHAVSCDLKNVRLQIDSPLPVEVYHGDAAKVDERGFRTNPPRETGIVWEPPDTVLVHADTVTLVPEGKSINFWLTFHADHDAPAGQHTGRITISAQDRPQTVIDLALSVRPFRLGRARIAFGLYWPDSGWSQHLTTDEQWTAAYRDMAQHGQTSVGIYDYSPWFKVEPHARQLVRLLKLGTAAGLMHADVPCLWLYGGGTLDDEASRTKCATWLKDQSRQHGWPAVIRYGPDEPPYPYPQVRKNWLPWRKIPMPVGTAIDAKGVYGHSDLFDVWIVRVDGITAELAAEAKRMGAELWCYDHRIRSWHPLKFRYMTGLFTWATRVKGNYTWCGTSYAQMWWPTVGAAPMPILGWEARREGVDDYRYLQLLEDAIAANSDDLIAIEAAAWLESLRARVIVDPMSVEPGTPLPLEAYEHIRDRASHYIQKLGAVEDEAVNAVPLTGLLDEAAPLREQTIEQCIDHLRSPDAKTRRAAAWSLFERGPAALPATDTLAELLNDPQMRIVCLRAIEAIGPDAYPAIPRVTALLSHPDPFVRIGATHTLGAIGAFPKTPPRPHEVAPPAPTPSAPAVAEALRAALRDDSAQVVDVAARYLSRLGPLAAAALPDAIALLDHDESGRRGAAHTLIRGLGPQAVAAVPKLVSRINAKQGNFGADSAAGELTCLAAIGAPAKDAVDDLVRWRSHIKDGHYWLRSRISHALFCIRNDTEDLNYMVRLMTDHKVPDWELQQITGHLDAVGAAAAPVADEIRELVEGNKYPGLRARLEDILQRIEKNEAATPVAP